MVADSVSAGEARRLAISAQGLARARPKPSIGIGHIRDVINRLGLLQLDFVNVLVPAHFLVLFSRLGPYDTEKFRKLVYERSEFTEQWAHEASVVPSRLWPFLKHRREAFRPYPNSPIMRLKGKSRYLKEIYEIIEKTSAVTSRDLPQVPGPKRNKGDWHRSVSRWALEYHFGYGNLAVRDRLANFQRVYDLPERVLDKSHLEKDFGKAESQRELLRIAATAHGIATEKDLADYYRMTTREARPRIAELVEQGELRQVNVEGWSDTAYRAPGVRVPRQLDSCRLLSPFDPLVWYRPRAERLFDFFYRIEIYVPEKKRRWGYYVLPFLMNDRLVARIDLKADRSAGKLLVLSSHPENGIDLAATAERLAAELRLLADWLGLEVIKVSRRGPFAKALADVVRAG